MIIDAGFEDDGQALVEHVHRWYGGTKVDLAILAHPDADRILPVVAALVGSIVADAEHRILARQEPE